MLELSTDARCVVLYSNSIVLLLLYPCFQTPVQDRFVVRECIGCDSKNSGILHKVQRFGFVGAFVTANARCICRPANVSVCARCIVM